MEETRIRFDDGAAYEDFMGRWSQLAGEAFLQWLAPAAGLRWVDVGCGNGAFTELLVQRCAPAGVLGVDPSEEQLAYARTRPATHSVTYLQGDAMALPGEDGAFDAAVMALVLFFVPDPARSVAEMARVVRPGGSVSAYSWDMFGGGFPFAALHEEMAALGTPPLWPPSADASRMEVMEALWVGAGLLELQTRQVAVQRRFDDFETFWRIAQTGPRIAPGLSKMALADRDTLKQRVSARLGGDGGGPITVNAHANAIQGRKPG